jgi:hypothetical protein
MKAFLFLLLTILAPTAARADDNDNNDRDDDAIEVVETPKPKTELGSKQRFWRIDLGLRGAGISGTGYAPYAEDNSLLQSSFGFSRTLWSASRYSLAAGAVWDASSQTQATRGAAASLAAQRFSATLEGRVHLLPWLYLFTRAAPGAVWAQSTIRDDSSFAAMSGDRWGASFDASGGVSFLLLPQSSEARARWWVTMEGGYGWTQALAFTLKPQASAADSANVAAMHLAALSLDGPLYRVTTGLSF